MSTTKETFDEPYPCPVLAQKRMQNVPSGIPLLRSSVEYHYPVSFRFPAQWYICITTQFISRCGYDYVRKYVMT